MFFKCLSLYVVPGRYYLELTCLYIPLASYEVRIRIELTHMVKKEYGTLAIYICLDLTVPKLLDIHITYISCPNRWLLA